MSFFSPVLFPDVLYYSLLSPEKPNPNFTAKCTLEKPVFVYNRQLMPMDCKKILHVYQKLSATYLYRSFLSRVNLFGNICYPPLISDVSTIKLLEGRS